jgi:hypothetical protein
MESHFKKKVLPTGIPMEGPFGHPLNTTSAWGEIAQLRRKCQKVKI